MSNSFEDMSYEEAKKELTRGVNFHLNEISDIINLVNRLVKQDDRRWVEELEQVYHELDMIFDEYYEFEEYTSRFDRE